MSEKEKMLAGKPYKSFEDELFNERQHAKDLIFQINTLHPHKVDERNKILRTLLGITGNNFHIEPPFYCDYGYNILVGENFYSNYNCTILDCALVTIGNNVLLGPNVALYTAGHPIHQEPRDEAFEYAFPITIGNSVWIGGNTVINPGIIIGDNSVIGSGSVVNKNIPSNVIAVGNPCSVLRTITEEDKQYYFKDLKF
ncbi:sugar O-acetyltransferase [Niabella ginsengisoli]|uniref:Acetyltransferase n=1 Tax=Niabella ginsengisoli TaxID=522298 RepID=A0ABS9SM41_9BACT|nr:sugar O-acetyltransferase [Niabella ginsengisoli]MCH5599420.1 sugar O-acetyltransferase [Niabella ginsengisoli]